MISAISIIIIIAVFGFLQTDTFRKAYIKSLERAHAQGYTPHDCQFDEQGKLTKLPWYTRY
jgi:hypothetical protein